ncbi:MAG: hypothetical protein AB8B95_16370 [Pseudohongiellaceae bacterium]
MATATEQVSPSTTLPTAQFDSLSPVRKAEKFLLPAGLCIAALPLISKWLSIASAYLIQGDTSHFLFIPLEPRASILILLWLVSISISTALAVVILIVRQLKSGHTLLEQRLLDCISLLMLAGLVGFGARLGIYGSTGAEVGSALLAIQSVSAFCLIGLYILNRLNRAKHQFANESSTDTQREYRLFANLTLIVVLTPLMVRTSYGVWYGVLGTLGEASFVQQFSIIYALYLVSMGIALRYNSSTETIFKNPKLSRTMPYVALATLLFGTFAYLTTGLNVEFY